CEVQYVDEQDFNSSGYANAITEPCVPGDLGAGFGDRGATVTITGLHTATAYHYRFIATNQIKVVEGADRTFSTFGIESFVFEDLDQEGHPFTQAGGHPYQWTIHFALNTTTGTGIHPVSVDTNPKDVRTELPPGLIGNPLATPRCANYNVAHADCPGDTQVGILKVFVGAAHGVGVLESGLYDLVPPKGMAAQFGARFNGFVTAHIDARIRTGG